MMRARSPEASAREAASVVGSGRASVGFALGTTTCSNVATVCGTLSSRTSKSSAVRSVTACPSCGHRIDVHANQVGFAAKPLPRVLLPTDNREAREGTESR